MGPPREHAKPERDALRCGCRIANVEKTGRATAVHKSPQYSLASHVIWEERSHAGRNLMPTSDKTREHRKRHQKKKARENVILNMIGKYGTVPHPPPGRGANGEGTNHVHRTSPFSIYFLFQFRNACAIPGSHKRSSLDMEYRTLFFNTHTACRTHNTVPSPADTHDSVRAYKPRRTPHALHRKHTPVLVLST